MNKIIPIRNHSLPRSPRVFNVIVNDNGEILRYEIKNIKGTLFIDEHDVREQIKEFLQKNIG